MAGKKFKFNFKRCWPLLLIALLLAVESAHAPLIGGASASTSVIDGANSANASTKGPGGISKIAVPPTEIPPTAERIDPSAIEKKLKELYPAVGSPLWTWDSITDPFLPTNGISTPVTLVPTQPDARNTTINGFDGGGGTTGIQTGPAYTIPPTVQPTVYNDGGGLAFNPTAGPVFGPIHHHGLIVTDATPVQVPEPGMMSMLLGGWVLLGRRRTSPALGRW